MTEITDQLRITVAARALARCEYCLFPQAWCLGEFEIDHILPRSAGGQTNPENLAFACPSCNAHKWAHTHGTDDLTGQIVPLFHPRIQVWSEHFQWSAGTPFTIEGRTECGRATVARLHMNHERVVALRKVLSQLGIIIPSVSS